MPHPHPLSSGLCGSYLPLQLHRNRRQPGGCTRLNGEEPGTRGVSVSHGPDLKPAQPLPSGMGEAQMVAAGAVDKLWVPA